MFRLFQQVSDDVRVAVALKRELLVGSQGGVQFFQFLFFLAQGGLCRFDGSNGRLDAGEDFLRLFLAHISCDGISCGAENGNGCPGDDGGHFFLVGPLFGNCGGFQVNIEGGPADGVNGGADQSAQDEGFAGDGVHVHAGTHAHVVHGVEEGDRNAQFIFQEFLGIGQGSSAAAQVCLDGSASAHLGAVMVGGPLDF